MGEESLQRFIVELFRPLVERWLGTRKVKAFVGADLFIYWRKHDATRRLAPDVFVLPGVAPGAALTSWKTWERGIVPSFALEVAARDAEKDYAVAPLWYAELGVGELVIFDPHCHQGSERSRWQVYRRSRGKLVRLSTSDEDRVESRELRCFLRVVGEGEQQRLRLGIGDAGDQLFLTEAEQERAAKEQERRARLEAEAEVARLRELLAQRKE